MEALSSVLSRFSISAGVFYTGNLCGIATFEDPAVQCGHLHLLKSGSLTLIHEDGTTRTVDKPALIFYPRPTRHRMMAKAADGADLVCASIEYGTGSNNPLANALPSTMLLPFDQLGRIRVTAEWLFEEAFSNASGRHAMMDRLSEVLVIQLFRFAIEQNIMQTGMLAGLANPQLARCIIAMHTNPERAWSLEELAALADMSRSKFASLFREIVGRSPGDYLIEWRIGVAQGLLKKGRAVSLVANDVGYENASALAKAFRKKVGLAPMAWLAMMRNRESASDRGVV